MLIPHLDSQQFQRQSNHSALRIIRHTTHISHRRDASRGDFSASDGNHALEVAIGEGVIVDGVMQSHAEGLWLWLFPGVDAVDGFAPEVELALGCMGGGVPREGSLAFSEILVSSMSKRWTA